MGRREKREQIFSLLFRVEFNSLDEMPEQIRLFFDDEERVMAEEDAEYVTDKYKLIQEKLPEIDKLLNEKAEKWDVTRMGKVDLTVLRLAVYEILFDEDIPASVAINEAVELAKKYGQENSGSFVNAVLAKFVKQGD